MFNCTLGKGQPGILKKKKKWSQLCSVVITAITAMCYFKLSGGKQKNKQLFSLAQSVLFINSIEYLEHLADLYVKWKNNNNIKQFYLTLHTPWGIPALSGLQPLLHDMRKTFNECVEYYDADVTRHSKYKNTRANACLILVCC